MTDTFFDRLGDELDTAAHRPPRRRPTPQLALAAAGIAVVAVVGITLVRSEPASADVEVEVRGGLVHLRLVDAEHDSDEIEAAAAEAGLDIDVAAVAVGPSLVGRFLDDSDGGARPGELRTLDEDGESFVGFVIPQGWPGRLDLLVGRPAQQREPYIRYGNAVSAGEPLACSGILGMLPTEARRLVTDLAVTWQVDGEVSRTVEADDLDQWDDHRVATALSTAPDTVVLVLTPDGSPPPRQQALTKPAEDC